MQVPGIGGAGSKTGAEPAPRIGLLRCSGGAGSGPKMEPAPLMAELALPIPEPAPSRCQCALSQLPYRCTYIGSRGTYTPDDQHVRVTDGCSNQPRQLL